jgi:hypothetical protein
VSLKAFFQTVVAILDRADVPYMLTGSLAAAYYAVPRATQDLDVVIEAERSGIERVVQGLRSAGLYVEQEAALEAQKVQGQFNAIDPSSGWKVDLIVRKDREYSQVEFGRRQQVRLLDVEVRTHLQARMERDWGFGPTAGRCTPATSAAVGRDRPLVRRHVGGHAWPGGRVG